MNADAITETLCTAVAVFPTVTDRIDANVLDVRPMRARFLGNYGVSYNHIDLDAARNADLVVTDTPDVLTDATADLTLALLLAVARRLGKASGSYATAHGAVGARRTLSALRSVEKPSG